jgi:hypothetical protein
MKITGQIKVVNPTVQVNDRFSKREFVVTDNSNVSYPQDILMQLTQDKCSLLDDIQINQQVEIEFNLRGKEWISPDGTSKFFNVLEAWKINKV